jgi:hypothetical protein
MEKMVGKCKGENCEKKGLLLCGGCSSVNYCSKECQVGDWKAHKSDCKKIKAQRNAPQKTMIDKAKSMVIEGQRTGNKSLSMMGAALAPSGSPSDWSIGLDDKKKLTWLNHCYRMRCDDDATYAEKLHGFGYRMYLKGGDPNDPEDRRVSTLCDGSELRENTAEGLVMDFLAFCFLAQRSGAVDRNWNWAGFLAFARHICIIRFEKADAKVAYGDENVFNVGKGGRSLRYTGEQIYGLSVQDRNSNERVDKAMEDASRWAAGTIIDEEMDKVGGKNLWRNFFLFFEKENKEGRLEPRNEDL